MPRSAIWPSRPQPRVVFLPRMDAKECGRCSSVALCGSSDPSQMTTAFIFVPSIYVPFVEAAARSHGVEIIKTAFRNGEDIARAINAVAAEPNGGLLVLPPDPSGTLRKT